MTLTTATELWHVSATDLAELVRTRHASSHEVVEAHLRRIEAANPSINAVVFVLGDQADHHAHRSKVSGGRGPSR